MFLLMMKYQKRHPDSADFLLNLRYPKFLKMNTEPNYWDIADKDFGLLLTQEEVRINNPYSAVLTSVFIGYRNNLKNRIASICEKAFKNFEKAEKDAENLVRETEVRYSKTPSVKPPKDSVSESKPNFCALFEDDTIEDSEYENKRIIEGNSSIIDGILHGNQSTFNELYENELPKVIRFVIRNSGDVDQAKDIFQDAIVILVEKVQRKELNLTCSIKTYLFSISQHLWMEQLRLAKNNTPFNKTSYQIPVDISVISFDTIPDIYDEVNKAIHQLNNNGKTILEYFYYKKMSCEEIAQLLGYSSAASVRNQKYKYLEQIRRAVKLEVHAD